VPDRLTAIIVNFNRRDLLLRAITSLRSQSNPPIQILVVDNGSTDDSVASVRTTFPRVEVVALGENLGSSGGFARGIAAGLEAGATHLLLLDSDVVLAPDCVAQLAQALASDPGIGVVGPKVYHWDSSTVLQEFGGWIDWDTADLRRSHWRHDEVLNGRLTADQKVDYVPACCLLATRAAVEAAGNFDPGWFLYWDDIDWCERVRATGRTIVATASARVQHFGGGANKRTLAPVYYGWRNRLTFFRRHTPPAKRAVAMRAFMEDFLLARFTCRTLGLAKTAIIMELGVEDALKDISGRKDFAPIDISLDDRKSDEPGMTIIERVHHVIGSATEALAARPALVLQDRFGKRMRADQAWILRQRFEIEKAQTLPELIERAR
jgi:GT2 family glycosyltransferase